MLIHKILYVDRLQIEGCTEEENNIITEKIENVLFSWYGTPYRKGKGTKGKEVDCVHFITKVCDELLGTTRDYVSLPPDTCFHNRVTAYKGFKEFLNIYPNVPVTGSIVQPGDVIICGPLGKNGGPGHAMITGKNNLWHVGASTVCKAGLGIFQYGTGGFKEIRRLADRTQLRRLL